MEKINDQQEHKNETNKLDFPSNEENILALWRKLDLQKQIVDKHKNDPVLEKTDGPPFVSSDNLHFGHIHIGIMKSVFDNYWSMHNMKVSNKIGYDVHGLPIEQVVSKMLNLSTNQQIREYGLANYNQKCEEVIKKFSGCWRPIYNRIARFVDFENEYKTMDLNFMESVWWAWKKLWDNNLTYRGYRIMPYSTACGTPLSASEASGEDVYKEVSDPAIYVKFDVKNDANTYFIAWTTTPWTLPSNLALAVNPTAKYVKLQDEKNKQYYIMAESCIKNLYPQKKDGTDSDYPLYSIVTTFLGKELENLEYYPLFNYFNKQRIFKVVTADFVDGNGSGSGLVHLAPAFGQDDFDTCIKNKIVAVEDVGDYCPIDDNGYFTSIIKDYKGEHVLSCNSKIIEKLKSENKLLKKEMYKHSYPHCWRTDTPLIYKAVSSFFVKVTALKERMLQHNTKVRWVPESAGNNRFRNWIENAKDWGVSRSRFFGTPIPVWISDDGLEVVCIGTIDELVKAANLIEKPDNLHPQYIQKIQIPSKQGKGMLKLVGDVFDCWFESGCVPFAQYHYPFENSAHFDNKDYLSDFVCEGLDQTRGWFYTLMVLSTAIFDKPPSKNIICSGLILAEDGRKFSKRLGNFVNPLDVCKQYGADAIRLYFLGSPAAHGDSFQFSHENLRDINAKYYQLYNCYTFLLENLTKYKKDNHVFDINSYKNSQNIMDNWILSRLATLLTNIELGVTSYFFHKVKPEILDFVEDLANWYIKFNRNRLRGRYVTTQEHGQALSTLYQVMLMFCKIVAPFLPFLAETMYQQLKQNNDETSVHLCQVPSVNTFNNPIVERQMRRLQHVAANIRCLRTKTKNAASAKVPIKKVFVINSDQEYLQDLSKLEGYMREEINSLDIEFASSCNRVNTKYKLEPNNKEIGTLFKDQAVNVKKLLSEVSQEIIAEYLKDKSKGIFVNKFVIKEPVFMVRKMLDVQLLANEYYVADQDMIIVIDCTLDDEVRDTYTKRLLVVAIQSMRKNTKLKPWNKIGIYYRSDSKLIDRVLTKYNKEITEQLIYPVYPINQRDFSQKEITSLTQEINGEAVYLLITDLTGEFLA